MWFGYALVAPFFWATANLFDSSLSNKHFRGTYSLVFYSTVFGLPLVALLFLFTNPGLPTLAQLPYILAIGILDICYRFPYLKALQYSDASVTVSLFSLGKLFTPLLAFIFAGELLQKQEYLGFLLILISSVLLTINFRRDESGRRISRSFWYMLLAAVIILPEAVIWRVAFANTEMYWATGFVWSGLSGIIMVLLFWALPKWRREAKADFPVLRSVWRQFLASELLTFTANALYVVALIDGPATLVQGVTSTQPFIVLGYALILGRFLPAGVREQLVRGSTLKKIILFGIMAVGVVLIREF